MRLVRAWISRMRWSIRYGATWRSALRCVNRGYHMWNVISDTGPIPPTSCLDCRAQYTEEWDAQKRGVT